MQEDKPRSTLSLASGISWAVHCPIEEIGNREREFETGERTGFLGQQLNWRVVDASILFFSPRGGIARRGRKFYSFGLVDSVGGDKQGIVFLSLWKQGK